MNFKKLKMMWMPIVQTIPDTGEFELIPYTAVPSRNDRKKCWISRRKLHVIEDKSIFTITSDVFDEIREFIGKHPAERGAMIGRTSDGVIRYCECDKTSRNTSVAYDPDIDYMNSVIKDWKKRNIEFCGFIHSHPRGITQPSGYDRWYAGEILACFKKLEKMWMPIVQTIPDTSKFTLFPYAAVPDHDNRKNCRIVRHELHVVEDKSHQSRNKVTTIKTVEMCQTPEDGQNLAGCVIHVRKTA